MAKIVARVAVLLLCVAATALATPLDDYVNRPDSHYKYEVLDEYRMDGQYIAYVLNMTSQKWLTYDDSNRAIWFHYMTVTIPDDLQYPDIAAIYVTGGSNTKTPPNPLEKEETQFTALLAVGAKCVTVNLNQIPNSPILFKDDPEQKSRTEDAIIAYTWAHLIKNGTGDPDWLIRLPMTKAVVRTMDTVTDFVYKQRGVNVTKYVVAGGSKRGWATWTTAAVDKRVVGIAPMVLDCLNLVQNMHHMYRSLGGWTFAFSDYYEQNITLYLDDPNTQILADIVDPYAYRNRLTMPKLIISAGSDEFFLPDDSWYYFDGLPEPKYLRITPNAEHTLTLHRVELMAALTSFMYTLTRPDEWTAPKMHWDKYENSTHGVIDFTSDPIPLRVEVFRALTNRNPRRDFRIVAAAGPGDPTIKTNLIIYKKFHPRSPSPGRYIAEFLTPHIGWQCFFMRAFYNSPSGMEIAFTTEANITPMEKFAVPDCHGKGCKGLLV